LYHQEDAEQHILFSPRFIDKYLFFWKSEIVDFIFILFTAQRLLLK